MATNHARFPFLALQLAGALALLGASSGAQAQLRLPGGLPSGLPGIGLPAARLDDADRVLRQLQRDLPDVRELRQSLSARLLRQHPDVLEADPRGFPAVRHEILAFDPSPAALAAAQAAGSRILRRSSLDDGGPATVVLGVPDGVATAAMLDQLRALDADGVYDFNHIYVGSGSGAGVDVTAGAAAAPAARTSGPIKVGLVDSGVDSGHAAFRDAKVERWGCGGELHPDAHGTAVAALMVGQAPPFRGGAPGAHLYAADIYCGSAAGGSADRIAAALAWLAGRQVGVINLSLVGPANRSLEQLVAALVKRGHLLVAAVGNDGPAAPPLYPASYPGVVGVSAVGRSGQPLPEAARGPQVMFAAPGNNMLSAAIGQPAWRAVRGTSFAAPLVAALLAEQLPAPDKAKANQAVAALARQAVRPAGVTVSNETGYGIVGAELRTDPTAFKNF